MDHFETLVMTVASSKNCPYTCTELWGMYTEDLFKVRDMVFMKDALEYAIRKDQEPPPSK